MKVLYEAKYKIIEIYAIARVVVQKYGHTFTKERLLNRMEQLSSIWNKELGRLLPENKFVKYKEVNAYLLACFKTAGLI
ncbi:hypothetical protein M1278_00970 [Candidatus Marsarchaeota archaeon]|nr:hypothetical protein [Candidatus Marsarchaeota archaeon]